MIKKNSKLIPGVVKKLQDFIADKIIERGFEDETVHETLLLLVEEVGELVKAVRKMSGMNVSKHSKDFDPGQEMVDVINLIFAVGVKLDLDIEKEFIKKNIEIDKRIYKRIIKEK